MVGVQRKLEKLPRNSEISMLTVSNSEHDRLKRRRGLPSTAIKLLMDWRIPGNTVAANE